MAENVHYFWYGSGSLPEYTVESIGRTARLGYTPTLWVYSPVRNAPAGCVTKDAGQVVPHEWFRTNVLDSKMLAGRKESVVYASFSDVFRAAVLFEVGGWWFDVDVIPLRRLPEVEAVVATCPRRLTGPYARSAPHFSTVPDGDINTSVMFAKRGAAWLGEYLNACRAYFEARNERAAPNSFSPWLSILVRKMPVEFAAGPLLFNPIPAWTTKLGCTSFGFDVPSAAEIRAGSYTVSLSGELLKAHWRRVVQEVEGEEGGHGDEADEGGEVYDEGAAGSACVVGAEGAVREGDGAHVTVESSPAERGTEQRTGYVIVIRTYSRRGTIEQHTLEVLRDLDAPIYIFCGTDEMERYKQDFPRYHVRDGGESGVGVCNDRIADHFPEGQRILQCDDDVTRFVETKDGKLLPGDLKTYVRRGFEMCDEKGLKLFGFYPVANAMFMQGREEVSLGLSFVMGGIHGFVNDRRLRTRDQYRDDYERSILSWIHFGGVVRFNRAKACNIIYRNSGGHARTRTLASMQASCDYMLRTYPRFCAPKRCKSGFPEIRIVPPRTGSRPKNGTVSPARGGGESDGGGDESDGGGDERACLEGLRTVGFHRRSKDLNNRSVIFGVTRSLQHGPSISQSTHDHPELVRTLLRMMRDRKPDFKVTSICVNLNFVGTLHKDANNLGETHMLTLGDFSGGELWIYPDRVEPTRGRWVEFDGRVPHCTFPYEGKDRYSIIFFAANFAARAPAPVREEANRLGFRVTEKGEQGEQGEEGGEYGSSSSRRRVSIPQSLSALPLSLASRVPERFRKAFDDLRRPPDSASLPLPPERWISSQAQSTPPCPRLDASPPHASPSARKPPAFGSTSEWDAHASSTLLDVFCTFGSSRKARRSIPVPDASCFSTLSSFENAREWRLCIDPSHVGSRAMPLTSDHFNSTGGQLSQCKQCKLRYVHARRKARRGDTTRQDLPNQTQKA